MNKESTVQRALGCRRFMMCILDVKRGIKKNVCAFLVFAIAVSAFVTGVYFSNCFGFWTDEIGACSTVRDKTSISSAIVSAAQGDTAPPLYDVIGYFCMKLTGTLEPGFRLPSCIFTFLSIILIFRLAMDLHLGKLGASLASLLLAISPTSIRYSYEGRPYALEVLLVITFWLLFRRYSQGRSRSLNGVALLAVWVLSLLTHYFLVIPEVIIIVLYSLRPLRLSSLAIYWRNELSHPLVLVACVITGIVTLAIAFFYKIHIASLGIARSTYHTDLSPHFFLKFLGQQWESDQNESNFFNLYKFDPVPIAILILAIPALFSKLLQRRDAIVMSTLVIAGVIGSPVLAWKSRNLLSVRFSIYVLPALCIMLGAGFSSAIDWTRTHWNQKRGIFFFRLFTISTVVIMLASATCLFRNALQFIDAPYFHQWKEIANYCSALEESHRVIAIISNEPAVHRNLMFYKPNLRAALKRIDLNHMAETWGIVIGSGTAQNDYLASVKSRPGISLAGTLPNLIVFPPLKLTTSSFDVSRLKLEELLRLYPFIYGDRRAWTLAKIIAASNECKNLPACSIACHLLLKLDIDLESNAYAWLMLGQYRKAAFKYEKLFHSIPSWEQQAYMWSEYGKAFEEAGKKDRKSFSLSKAFAINAQAYRMGMNAGIDLRSTLVNFANRHPEYKGEVNELLNGKGH
jgi:uncharacterized membrane protein